MDGPCHECADSCLAFLQQQLPDVILMDINLPDKSGIDLCKEVKDKISISFYYWTQHFQPAKFYSKNDG